MKKLWLIGLLLAGNWVFADERPADKHRLIVNSRGAAGTFEDNRRYFSIAVKSENPNDSRMICDVFGKTTVSKSSLPWPVMEVKKFLRGVPIEALGEAEFQFRFYICGFSGCRYMPSRKNLRIYASCAAVDEYESLTCDPRVGGPEGQHCDYTCVAMRSDPTRCAAKFGDGPQWPEWGKGAEDQPEFFYD